MEKGRLQNINECADVLSTRTRQRCTSYSNTDEDKTAQHFGSYHSTKFGMAQPKLADILLATDFILFFVMVTKLDVVKFSTLGKFSAVARVATRRMARPKVVGEMVSEDNRRFMCTPASGNWQRTNTVSTFDQVALSSHISLQSCTFISHEVFFFFKRLRDQTLANVVIATASVQITPPCTHACAHFSCAHNSSHNSSNAHALALDV